MSMSKFFAGALVGLAAGVLLTSSERGEELKNNISDAAGKWKRKLSRLSGRTSAELEDLRDMLENEVEGLGDDVRRRLLTIIEESKDSARNIKNNVATEFR